ncbi:creatininase family protein [Alloyangia pacifica]|uniref:Creatinine amidohydrolase n=1 Tax=Alloyangia pacifica TaxID=311180 RepID=A0A1I6VH09_9RHOB|nr:creatininase family protein [Alloyangia pacifica]SDH97407.1 creatinine amidohydrolase [Alloyangia pacifica]SFT12927.1 creatinine amidohydrolase [Alloyangia pacifica]
MRFEQMTSPELQAVGAGARRPLAVIPCGAVEQHGPHLGVGTDHLIASAVAEAAVARAEGTLLLPAVPYGVSPHHRAFTGTLSLSAATFVSLLTEIGQNLWDDGFLPVFLNAHGGNRPALGVAVSTLGAAGAGAAAITWFEHVRDVAEATLPDAAHGTGHAGALETSVMMHLHGAAVRPDKIKPGSTPEGWPDPHLYAGPSPTIWRSFDAISPDGVIGTPSEASAAAGATLFEAAATRVAGLLTQISKTYG